MRIMMDHPENFHYLFSETIAVLSTMETTEEARKAIKGRRSRGSIS